MPYTCTTTVSEGNKTSELPCRSATPVGYLRPGGTQIEAKRRPTLLAEPRNAVLRPATCIFHPFSRVHVSATHAVLMHMPQLCIIMWVMRVVCIHHITKVAPPTCNRTDLTVYL